MTRSTMRASMTSWRSGYWGSRFPGVSLRPAAAAGLRSTPGYFR
jgi:hypothetical protein